MRLKSKITIINRCTLWAGLLAAPFYLVLIISLGALEPGFSHLSMPMSILGGVPGIRGFVFNLGVAVTGAFLIFFASTLARQLPHRWSAKTGVLLLVLGGIGFIGAAYFHCNEGCINIFLEPDVTGRLHIIASLLGGMGSGLAPFFIWLAMRGQEKWKGFATPTLMAAILANLPGVTFWIMIATGLRLHSVEGLIQRMGFIVVLIWIFFITIKLRRLQSHMEVRTS